MASTTLTRLLSDLKSVRSPLERMRMMARAWRSLRRLRPEERKLLATQVGMEGAEEILEGLGRGEKRLAPVVVMQALEKAKKDPSSLHSFLKNLKNRYKRGEMLQSWLDSVGGEDDHKEEAAEDDAPASPQGKPSSPASEPEPAPAAPPAVEKSSSESEKREAPRAVPVAPLPLAVSPAIAAAVPKQNKSPSPASKSGPRKSAPPASPAEPRKTVSPPPTRPRRVPPPSGPVTATAARQAPATPEKAKVAARPPADGPSLAKKLQHAEGLMARFRVLRTSLDPNGGSSLGDVPQILEAFPAGWARRRALDALLRHRLPAGLDQALALIGELESSMARRWCLRTILEHWELTPQQEERVEQQRRA
jgi:hypothetical protein